MILEDILERMVSALMLVEQLALHGLQFVFQGGTSVALVTNSLHRLSIDVDIEITDATTIPILSTTKFSITMVSHSNMCC